MDAATDISDSPVARGVWARKSLRFASIDRKVCTGPAFLLILLYFGSCGKVGSIAHELFHTATMDFLRISTLGKPKLA
jgi:hypothetical protein